MISSLVADPDMVVAATIVEDEGVTSVVSVADAERLGHRPGFVAAWLTLDVESALDSVGLTATVPPGRTPQVVSGFAENQLPSARTA